MKILLAGDFCPCNRIVQSFNAKNYSSSLSQVKEITDEADYSIVNFECPVVTGNSKPIEKIGPNLRCTRFGVEAINNAGFDCVTLANNDFRDFGDEGISETLQTLKEYGVEYVGGGLNIAEASRVLYKDIAGQRLAIINCCEHEFSIATDKSAGSNPLNPVQQFYAIKEAKNNADYVLVIVHGGHEHFQLPSPRMVETYRFFVDAGADAVVNHHQHCYSGYEMYKEKPIFYGLGNFCFDDNNSIDTIWNKGYLVIFSFERLMNFQIFPYSQCSNEPIIKMLPTDSFDEKISSLNTIIANEKLLNDKVNSYYHSCEKPCSYIFEPIMNRVYYAMKKRGLLPSLISHKRKLMAANQVICESHRDKLQYYLNDSVL